MKSARVILPVVCFAAAVLAMHAWRPRGVPTSAADPKNVAVPTALTTPVKNSLLDPFGALMATPGIPARPSLEEVFAVEGVDRNLRMTVFIQNATSAELAEALARADEEEIWHPALTDQIWLRWTEVDPAAAIASKANVGQAWWAWAKTDPVAALTAAKGKQENLGKVIRSIGDGDPAWAKRLIAEHPEADQPAVWDGILESLSESDPAGAASLAMERKANLQAVLTDWTTRQPEAALAWVQALPDGPARRQAREIVVRKRCAVDPAAGLPEALKLPPGQSRDGIVKEAVTALALTDPAAATAVAQSLPPGDGRQQALGALAEKLFADDPAKALQVLAQVSWREAVSPAQQRWEYVGGMGWSSEPGRKEPPFSAKGALEKLVELDASNTLRTLAALPADREAPVADAVWQWSAKEPEAASAWLRDQPPGEARDRGIDGLVRRLTDREHADYDAALTWAASASPAARDKLLRKALNSYAATDPAAAAAAADNLGIQPGPMAKYSPGRPY